MTLDHLKKPMQMTPIQSLVKH